MSDIDPQHVRLLEAILFASDSPLSERRLADRLPEGSDVKGTLAALADVYRERGVHLVRIDRAWAFRTAPDLAPLLTEEQLVQRKLSRAAIETLAIIAYHQPITRAEIEEIRGVQVSKGTMDALFEEGWIRTRGRRETPGRPVEWVTTAGFLDHFGLQHTRDLPGIEELRAAGLLDTRPAIQAYRETQNAAAVPPDDDVPPPESDEESDEGPGEESGTGSSNDPDDHDAAAPDATGDATDTDPKPER